MEAEHPGADGGACGADMTDAARPHIARLARVVAEQKSATLARWLACDLPRMGMAFQYACLTFLVHRALADLLDADSAVVVVHHFVHHSELGITPRISGRILVRAMPHIRARMAEAACTIHHLVDALPELSGDAQIAAHVLDAWLPRARARDLPACLRILATLGLAATRVFDERGGIPAVARIALAAPPRTRGGGNAPCPVRLLAFAVLGTAARMDGHMRAKVYLAAWRHVLPDPPVEAAPLAEVYLEACGPPLAPEAVRALAVHADHPFWLEAARALHARYGAAGAPLGNLRTEAYARWCAAAVP